MTKTQILAQNVTKLYRRIKRTARKLDIELEPGDTASCAVGTIARGVGTTFVYAECECRPTLKSLKEIAGKAHLTVPVLQQLEHGFEGRSHDEGDVQVRSAYYRLGLRLREEALNAA